MNVPEQKQGRPCVFLYIFSGTSLLLFWDIHRDVPTGFPGFQQGRPRFLLIYSCRDVPAEILGKQMGRPCIFSIYICRDVAVGIPEAQQGRPCCGSWTPRGTSLLLSGIPPGDVPLRITERQQGRPRKYIVRKHRDVPAALLEFSLGRPWAKF